MTFKRSMCAVLLCCVALCAQAAKPKSPPQAKPAAVPAGPLEFVHQLAPDAAAQLQKMVNRYNAGNPKRKIELLERKFDPAAVDKLPALMILDEDHASSAGSGRLKVKPIHQLMREAGATLETLKPPAQMSPASLDSAGHLVGLPVGLETPVMYINRNAFKKAGLNPDDPPKTWWDLQTALGALRDAGSACPYTSARPVWVHLENMSAWHNEPFAAGRGGQDGPLAVNGLVQIKHLALLASWYKSRYLRLFGHEDQAVEQFVKGDCQVLTAASSVYPSLRHEAGFDLSVARLPYYDDVRGAPQNTLASGAALFAAAGLSRDDYKGVAAFVKFLLEPESQVEWQRETGFLPLNRAGLLAATQSSLLKDDFASIKVAIDQLTNKPATGASSASRYAERADVRQILDDALDELWSDRKPAKQALDDAVQRTQPTRATAKR
ncbi:MAG: extracellular solute-binding protein [Rhodocyclaceae bacterium]|nr:extracellular solute-binding protein [Rhodocyclaceae bacterium]MBX3669767.1 extracellular solute-binding protein [Rhodocyclaceae bacterium]